MLFTNIDRVISAKKASYIILMLKTSNIIDLLLCTHNVKRVNKYF